MTVRYTLHDPLAFPKVTLTQLDAESAPVTWIEPGTSNRKYFRRSPFAHFDPDGAKIFPDLSSMEIPYPPVYATSITNATLVGFRTLLKDSHVLIDEVVSTPATATRHVERLDSPDEHRNERTRLRRIAGSNAFELDEPQETPIHIEQPVILLSSDEPENYGSFLFRVLPKLAFSRRLAGEFKLLVSLPHESMSRLLEISGVDLSDVIIHNTKKVYRLDRVIAPSVRNPHAFLDEVTIGLFNEIRTKIAPESVNKHDLIFVSRRNLGSTKAGYRAMENETEVRLCLEQLGFRTICPETMSADEQIKTFASAAVVVGQSGGAMFNVAFCKPGTIVIDIESEPHWIHAHMSYFSSVNLRYVVFEGKPTPLENRSIHLPFRVNARVLKAALDEILANDLQLASRAAPVLAMTGS
jgi:capsular polysaccharide biosynthesis protein